ncbi:MAG: L-threonylcarbamoyladenylate synthase [Planctomycetota bacterium]
MAPSTTGVVAPTPSGLAAAAESLREGRLIGIPTETVYGLAARGDDDSAVANIFIAKRRPATNPLILHVADRLSARSCLADDLDPVTQRRFDRAATLWPGPLTLIGAKSSRIPDRVTAGGPTVGVRIPNHPVTLALLSQLDFPVAAPSANVANYISPTTAGHVWDGLHESLALVLDGGPCAVGLESTIVSLGDSHRRPRILRAGGVDAAALQSCLGEPVESAASSVTPERTMATAPGQSARHYSPATPLHLVSTHQVRPTKDGRCLRIHAVRCDTSVTAYAETWTISDADDWTEVARELYATLRRADAGHFDHIDMDMGTDRLDAHQDHLVKAIEDRLRRASTS